jgi:hypothetical protein
VEAIVARAVLGRFSHAILRLSDGAEAANVRPDGADLALALGTALTQAGIEVWGWCGFTGDAPGHARGPRAIPYHLLEAHTAVERVRALQPAGLVGLVVDARVEYERSAQPEAYAEAACGWLRDQLPDLTLALSSWKSPGEHPYFPWYAFRRLMDIDLPHIFWVGQPAEAARQVTAAHHEYLALSPRRLIGAVGSALWQPQPAELVEFLTQAKALGLEGASVWRWDELGLRGNEAHNRQGLDLRRLWESVAAFPWPVERAPSAAAARAAEITAGPSLEPLAEMPPTLKRFFILLRRGQWRDLLALYASDVAQLAAHHARYGHESLAELLTGALSGADFASLAVVGVNDLTGGRSADLRGAPPAASIYSVRWVLDAGQPDVRSGAETFHLNRKGEIVFHATALLGP